MKKRKKGRKLSRKRDPRRALLKTLASSLVLYGKITTTEAKAKELKPFIERSITCTKKENSLHARRLLGRYFSHAVAKKLMMEIGPRYRERRGGYTRIIKLGPRKTDAARMAVIELVK